MPRTARRVTQALRTQSCVIHFAVDKLLRRMAVRADSLSARRISQVSTAPPMQKSVFIPDNHSAHVSPQPYFQPFLARDMVFAQDGTDVTWPWLS